jgi:uncharacterized protein involved in exopolysaccharide biosynthesis
MSTTTEPNLNPPRSFGIFNRITRRWALILPLWLIITTPILYLIHLFVQPTFEAFSVLSVTPVSAKLFEPATSEPVEYKSVTPYLETQVNLITSDRVLGVAINYPEVVNLSTITNSAHPRADLREQMTVEIVPNAHLIRVAMKLPDGNQAAAIVNAVVHSYLAYNREYRRSKNSILRTSLEAQAMNFKTEINDKQAELKALYERSLFDLHRPLVFDESGEHGDPTRSPLVAITEAQAERIADELINTDLELIKTRSILDATQAASKGDNDPDLKHILSDLRLKIAALLKQREYQAAYFRGLKVDKKIVHKDTSQAAFVQRQIETLMKRQDQVMANVLQLDFEAGQDDFRVNPVDAAVAPKAPTNDKPMKYMAAAPIAVLLALLGLAALSPIRGERVRTEV